MLYTVIYCSKKSFIDMNQLTCKKCEKPKEDIGVTGLCESCAERFFSNGFIGTAALAKLLGIGSNRLIKYEKSGELIPLRNGYGSRIFKREDVENLLNKRSIKGVRKYRAKRT
jgi:hypothetical protein